MEVLPPTLAANSLACSIEEERTASAIVLYAVARLERVVDVLETHGFDTPSLEHRDWSRFGRGEPFPARTLAYL